MGCYLNRLDDVFMAALDFRMTRLGDYEKNYAQCPLIDLRSLYFFKVLSERGSVINVHSRRDDEGSSQTRLNDQNQSYFFDRRWRACQCHLKRTTSNADIFGSAYRLAVVLFICMISRLQ